MSNALTSLALLLAVLSSFAALSTAFLAFPAVASGVVLFLFGWCVAFVAVRGAR